MKRYKILAAVLLAAAALVSCSGKSTPAVQSEAAEAGKTAETRSFSVGDTEYLVPQRPRRIAADYYTGELLKLEAPLAGADLTYKSSAWEGLLEGVIDTGQSLEAVMALEPDLIITINPGMMEQYRAIAPTVLIPYGLYNPEELILQLAVLTASEERAETWLTEFNRNIEALRQLVPDKKAEYTIIDAWGGNAYLYGEHYGRGGYIIYNKLGLKGTPDGERDYIRKADSYLNLTVEALPRYAGDSILLMSSTPGEVSFFTDNIVWETLPAVEEDRVIYLNSGDFQFSDPFSLDLQVKILTEIFEDRQ